MARKNLSVLPLVFLFFSLFSFAADKPATPIQLKKLQLDALKVTLVPFEAVAAMEDLKTSNIQKWEDSSPSCCWLCNGSFCIWSCTVGSCACGGHICTAVKPKNVGLIEPLLHRIDLESLPKAKLAAIPPKDELIAEQGPKCCQVCTNTICVIICGVFCPFEKGPISPDGLIKLD